MCLFKNCRENPIKDILCLEHLNKYKCLPCKHFENNGICPFGVKCTYAHGKHELREFTNLSDELLLEEQKLRNESNKDYCVSSDEPSDESLNMLKVSKFIADNNVVINEFNKCKEIKDLEKKMYKADLGETKKLLEIKGHYTSKILIIKNECNLNQSLHNIENGLLKFKNETLFKKLEYLECVRKRKLNDLNDLICKHNLTSDSFLLIKCTVTMLYELQNKCFVEEIISNIKKNNSLQNEEFKRDKYIPVKNILLDKIFKVLADTNLGLDLITSENLQINSENTECIKNRLLDVIEHIENLNS